MGTCFHSPQSFAELHLPDGRGFHGNAFAQGTQNLSGICQESLFTMCIDSCDAAVLNMRIRNAGGPMVGSNAFLVSTEQFPIGFGSSHALNQEIRAIFSLFFSLLPSSLQGTLPLEYGKVSSMAGVSRVVMQNWEENPCNKCLSNWLPF